jgi:hypothetical protein
MEPTEPATEIDLARLAAFIDGEGHISISSDRKHRYYTMQITLASRDFELLEWCLSHFGGFLCRQRYRAGPKNYAPVKRWRLTSWQAASALERSLACFVCKREQAEIAVEFQKTFSSPGSRITESDLKRRGELRMKLRGFTKTGPRSQREQLGRSRKGICFPMKFKTRAARSARLPKGLGDSATPGPGLFGGLRTTDH